MRRLAAGALALWFALPAPLAAATEPPAPDPVIALSFRGAHRAYPLRVFSGRRVVNDVVGSMEVAVFHDPEKGQSAAWFRTVLGEPIEFPAAATGGVAEDLTTITRWDLATGVAIAGNLQGQRLVPIPFTVTTWAEWLAAHPRAAQYRPEGGAEAR